MKVGETDIWGTYVSILKNDADFSGFLCLLKIHSLEFF